LLGPSQVPKNLIAVEETTKSYSEKVHFEDGQLSTVKIIFIFKDLSSLSIFEANKPHS